VADNKSSASVDSLYNRTVGIPDSANTQKKTVGATSQSTTVLKGNASYEISCDVTCHICFAQTLTAATANHPWFFAGSEKVIHTGADTTWYVSVIQDTTGGTMFVTELLPDRLG